MSVKSAPYYWLVCDAPGCGVSSTEGCEFTAWQTLDGAYAAADGYGSDWRIVPSVSPGTTVDTHYCDEHAGNVCTECGKYDAAPYAGERDYLCVECAADAGIIVCSSCGMPADFDPNFPTHTNECEATE